jgi:hypothetical protein
MRSAAIVWLTVIVGCVPTDHSLQPTSEAELSAMSFADQRVVDYVNHETTTVEVLDTIVDLDRRAALGIVAHRAAGSFVHIDEVDNVRFVGPVGLDQLYDHSLVWQPKDEPLLGEYDNIVFTLEEGELVLDYANLADSNTLWDAGLWPSVIETIMVERPLFSVRELSELHGVGETTLNRLLDAVVDEELPPPIQ